MSRKMKESLSEYAGEIPCTWNDVPIKYITTCNDDTLSESTNKDFAFEYIDIGSVKYGKGIINVQPMTFEDSPSRARRIVKSNDVIISTVRTYLKAVAIIPKIENPTIVSTGFAVLRAKKNIDSKFLQYTLSNDTFVSTVEKYSNGVSYPAINSTELIKFKIPVPPLEEQQNIADFLDSKTASIDSAIQAQKDIVEKLKEYKQSVITEAVTKGLNPDAEMKDSGIEWIGEIPKSWEVMPNKYLMTKQKDLCPVYNGENILSLSMRGVYVRDPYDESGKRPKTYDGYQFVYDGDLLMCLFDIDVTPRCVGRVYDNGLTSPAYSRFVMNRKKANVDYYYYYYLALDFDKTLLHLAKNMRSSFTETDFGRINAPVPPIKEQQQIVEYLDSKTTTIDKAIEQKNAIIEKLEEYKKSIIYNAVTGKIDCRKDVIPE